jgi:hypothetical protein
MPQCYSKQYEYIIKYHAKSGCTLFRHLFLELHKDELPNNILVSHHIIEKLFPHANEKVLLKIHLVRNPYTRVVSMFTNKMCSGLQGTLNNKITLEKHTFYHFVKYLYDNRHDLRNIDNHVYSQCMLYEADDVIVKLETFQADMLKAYDRPKYRNLVPKLIDIIGDHPKTISSIVSPRHQDDLGFVGLVEYTPNSKGPWSPYKHFYNNEIKNMVYETYKKEFELYKYDIDGI